MRSIWTTPSSSSPSPHKPETSPPQIDRQMTHPTHRLPSLSNPPALDPNWPGSRYDPNSFDQEAKRRKVTSPYMTTHHHMPRKQLPPATAPDTYYHQSRRKKRDTKPPNANDVRPFVEVERRSDGSYVLPAEVDSWTVLSLGTVVWDKAAFHNQRYIYPVGYRVKK